MEARTAPPGEPHRAGAHALRPCCGLAPGTPHRLTPCTERPLCWALDDKQPPKVVVTVLSPDGESVLSSCCVCLPESAQGHAELTALTAAKSLLCQPLASDALGPWDLGAGGKCRSQASPRHVFMEPNAPHRAGGLSRIPTASGGGSLSPGSARPPAARALPSRVCPLSPAPPELPQEAWRLYAGHGSLSISRRKLSLSPALLRVPDLKLSHHTSSGI